MSLHSSKIAALNDALRASLLDPLSVNMPMRARILLTAGVSDLSWEMQSEILRIVGAFDGFTPDNNPHGERDFGAFTHPVAGRVFWKIDYYNLDLTGGSPNPADVAATCRVLTIMLATEY